MADFQTVVNVMPAVGMPGQQISTDGAFTPFNYLSDGTVTAGAFAFADPAEAADGMAQLAHATVAANGRLLGFVARVHSGVMEVPFVSSSNVYAEGQSITIAIRGQFYMSVPEDSSATEGQSVLCDPKTGKVTFGKAGDANDTGWIVHLLPGTSAAAEGDLVIIEHFGVQSMSTTTSSSGGSGGASSGDGV